MTGILGDQVTVTPAARSMRELAAFTKAKRQGSLWYMDQALSLHPPPWAVYSRLFIFLFPTPTPLLLRSMNPRGFNFIRALNDHFVNGLLHLRLL